MKQKKRLKSVPKSELQKEKKLFGMHYAAKEDRLYHRMLRKFRLEKPRFWWAERKLWQKISIIFISVLMLFVGSMYGIARWYIASQSQKEFKFGATFIPSYAEYFGLDPEETMQAKIGRAHV